MIAAGAGNLDVVRELVQHGADVNATDPRAGQTALMWAAAEGHSDVVDGLIALGANVNAASKTGFTPLVFAVVKGDLASMKSLVAAGANPDVALRSGAKPVIVAMQYRHTDAALTLLDAGADFRVSDRAGNTTLHLAAQAGDLALVRVLLGKGADPNARTPKSAAQAGARGGGGGGGRGGPAGEQTTLMVAARADRVEVMRELVAAGANPALTAQDGSTLLMAAASGARLATFKYAYEIDPTSTSSPRAAARSPRGVAMNGRLPEVCEVIRSSPITAPLDEMNGVTHADRIATICG
jgi:ankyrin repeat protein